MNTERVRVGDIELAYETFGKPTDQPLILVMGLGTQMIAWPDAFCAELADAGRFVVRFDNRDCGQSTHLDHLPAPLPGPAMLRRDKAPYRIEAMADDAIGLLDALGLERVDLVGASMGGFIAQCVALAQPHRLRSLTLMMTSTGSRWVGYPSPKIARQLMKRRVVRDKQSAVETAASIFRLIGSPGYAFDEEFLMDVAGRSYDRGYNPNGYLRQLAACVTQEDRTERLRTLSVPTLVLHGLNDPLVSSTGGLSLARTIPGARFVGYQGMGHDLPRPLWSPMAGEILRHGDALAGIDVHDRVQPAS